MQPLNRWETHHSLKVGEVPIAEMLEQIYSYASEMFESYNGNWDYSSWTLKELSEITSKRNVLGPMVTVVTHSALNYNFHNRFPYKQVVDLGTGKAHYYPISGFPPDISYVAIDTNTQAVNRAIAEKRLPRKKTTILSKPPPYPINGKIDGVISTSFMHIPTYSELTAMINDLASHMDRGAPICAIQDIPPGCGYLRRLPIDLLNQMINYLQHKYNLSMVDLTSSDEVLRFWAEYQRKYMENFLSSFNFGRSVKKNPTDNPQYFIYDHPPKLPFPTTSKALEYSEEVLDIVAGLRRDNNRGSTESKSLEGLKRLVFAPQDSSIVALIYSLIQLSGFSNEVSDLLVFSKDKNSHIPMWVNALYDVVAYFDHDLYEAYLYSLLKNLGFNTEAERSAIFLEENEPIDIYYMDGLYAFGMPQPENKDMKTGMGISIRTVIARK